MQSSQSSEHLTEDEQPEGTFVPEDVQNIQPVHMEQVVLPSPPLDEEAIRQGLIYPPPPDFYTRMPAGPQPPPPAIHRSSMPPATWSTDQQAQKLVSASPEKTSLEPEGVDTVNHEGVPPRIRPPMPLDASYPAPQVHAPYMQVKPSYTWLWMLITGLAILIFGSCTLAVWLGYSMFGSQLNNPYDANAIGQQQITNYYGAVQAKNYIQAYSYLHPEGSIQGLTQAQFVQRAQQQDTQFGDVLSFNPDTLDVPNNGLAANSFKESVDIGRAKGRNYTVNLTFQKIGSTWYITDFDKI
jgi:hypothetical protein